MIDMPLDTAAERRQRSGPAPD